jgi:hypothetical protein
MYLIVLLSVRRRGGALTDTSKLPAGFRQPGRQGGVETPP